MQKLIIVLFLFVTGFALAQTDSASLPLIELSSFSVESGEDLSLSASELEPLTEYDLSLTSPAGVERTETLQADEAGNLDYTVQLDEAGRWQLGLDKLEFNVTINVQETFSTSPENSEEAAEGETDDTEAGPVDGEVEDADEASALQEQTEEAFEDLAETESDTPETTPESDAETAAETDAETDTETDAETADETAESNSQTESDGDTPALIPAPDSDTDGVIEDEAASETSEEAAPLPNNNTGSGRRTLFESLATSLGRSGWYGVVALLLAIVALHMVLIAKYWTAQSVNFERRRILGRPVAPWSRAFAMRYYDLTEKIVILLLFVAVAVMAALASWSTPGSRADSWNGAVLSVFQNPWNGLLNLRPGGMNNIIWTFIVVLFLLAVLITVVWLFVPRLRWVGNAPRSAAYHLLAVLVPGSGLADEMWGLLLIIPWALFGLDALIDVMGWGFGLGLSLFWDVIIVAVIYLINLVAVIVEYLSYRRRMTVLKRDNPELAQEFGLLRSIQ